MSEKDFSFLNKTHHLVIKFDGEAEQVIGSVNKDEKVTIEFDPAQNDNATITFTSIDKARNFSIGLRPIDEPTTPVTDGGFSDSTDR